MTTEKRIELAAMFLARCINEQLDIRASGDTRKKLCMYALAWADALAEVAEGDKPKTRYDWSKAPEWAKYAATDQNGDMFWYDEPIRMVGGVDVFDFDGRAARFGNNGFTEDWANSAEARPNG